MYKQNKLLAYNSNTNSNTNNNNLNRTRKKPDKNNKNRNKTVTNKKANNEKKVNNEKKPEKLPYLISMGAELKKAINENNYDKIKEIFEKYKINIYNDKILISGRSYEAYNTYQPIFEYLLINTKNFQIINYILKQQLPIQYNNKEMIKFLEKYGGKISDFIFQYLLTLYPKKGEIIQDLLFISLFQNNLDKFKILIKKGATLDDPKEHTVMTYDFGYPKPNKGYILEQLANRDNILKYCIDENMLSDKQFSSIIKYLSTNSNSSIHSMVLIYDKVDKKDITPDSRLNLIVNHFVVDNYIDELEKALQLGYSPNGYESDYEKRPIFIAVLDADIEILKLLLNYKVNVNIIDYQTGESPLESALLQISSYYKKNNKFYNDYLEIITLLLKNGANPNKEPEYLDYNEGVKRGVSYANIFNKLTKFNSLLDIVNNTEIYNLLLKYNAKNTIAVKLDYIKKMPKQLYDSKEILDLSNKGLTTISDDIIEELYTGKYSALILSNNNLESIYQINPSLMKIEYLDVSNNPKLKRFDISSSKIKSSRNAGIINSNNSNNTLSEENRDKLASEKIEAELLRNSGDTKGLIFVNISNCPIEYIKKIDDVTRVFAAVNCNIKDIGMFPNNYSRYNDLELMLNNNPCPIGFINGYGSITKYSKKRIHRTIDYKYTYPTGITTHDSVNTIIIPKGTLLFRGSGKDTLNDDFMGITMGAKHYLYPNYNIFFYPYPYSTEKIFASFNYMYIFVLTHDVEIMLGVEPSHNTRKDRYDKNISYLTTCSEISRKDYSSSPSIKGHAYDPCFSNDFMAKNPSVVGMMVMAKNDTDIHIQSNEEERYFTKYRTHFIDHQSNVGIPEIILYPLKERIIDEIVSNTLKIKAVNSNERKEFYLNNTYNKGIDKYVFSGPKPPASYYSDNNNHWNNHNNWNDPHTHWGGDLKTIKDKKLTRDDFNFAIFHIAKHRSGFDYDDLWEFMENGCSPMGAQFTYKTSDKMNVKPSFYGSLDNYHITIDLATKMYVVYELCSPEIQARCVPITERYKFHYLNYNYNV